MVIKLLEVFFNATVCSLSISVFKVWPKAEKMYLVYQQYYWYTTVGSINTPIIKPVSFFLSVQCISLSSVALLTYPSINIQSENDKFLPISNSQRFLAVFSPELFLSASVLHYTVRDAAQGLGMACAPPARSTNIQWGAPVQNKSISVTASYTEKYVVKEVPMWCTYSTKTFCF